MSARRGKTQARRNTTANGGLPGWAWMVLGIVLTMVVVLGAPRFLKSGAGDGFFRPKPNPDAQPATASSSEDDDALVSDDAAAAAAVPTARDTDKAAAKGTRYDFYTLLPGEEVAMSDAELAASAREEAARRAQASATGAPAAGVSTTASPTPASAAMPNSVDPSAAGSRRVAAIATPTIGNDDAHYMLQAGAFGASGDAKTVKAKIALLGLGARVESAQIGGKTVYRVRMGPYGTASELAEAKRKLGSGGLPALAIKAK